MKGSAFYVHFKQQSLNESKKAHFLTRFGNTS